MKLSSAFFLGAASALEITLGITNVDAPAAERRRKSRRENFELIII
jgi:hypothetical protein